MFKNDPGATMADRRARRSLSGWAAAMLGVATVSRVVTTVLSYFAVGPLLGVLTYPLGMAHGVGVPIVEWVLAGLLLLTGFLVAIGVRIREPARSAGIVGWFVVADTVFHVLTIAVVVVAEGADFAGALWQLLALIAAVNLALIAMGVAVIRRANSIGPFQQDPPRRPYIRKPRLVLDRQGQLR